MQPEEKLKPPRFNALAVSRMGRLLKAKQQGNYSQQFDALFPPEQPPRTTQSSPEISPKAKT